MAWLRARILDLGLVYIEYNNTRYKNFSEKHTFLWELNDESLIDLLRNSMNNTSKNFGAIPKINRI